MLRHRLRTFMLWTGTTLSLLIVVAFAVSAWWAAMLQLGGVAIFVLAGSVTILIDNPFVDPIAFDWHSHGLSRWATFARSDGSGSWPTWIQFSILAVFAAVAVPTLLAGASGRRRSSRGIADAGTI